MAKLNFLTRQLISNKYFVISGSEIMSLYFSPRGANHVGSELVTLSTPKFAENWNLNLDSGSGPQAEGLQLTNISGYLSEAVFQHKYAYQWVLWNTNTSRVAKKLSRKVYLLSVVFRDFYHDIKGTTAIGCDACGWRGSQSLGWINITSYHDLKGTNFVLIVMHTKTIVRGVLYSYSNGRRTSDQEYLTTLPEFTLTNINTRSLKSLGRRTTKKSQEALRKRYLITICRGTK